MITKKPMEMKTTRGFILFAVVLVCLLPPAHGEAYFPDIPGYKTLICDFHTHTVFSDGTVWPTVRVDEAKREGLDAVALSDHIEYQPHKNDISTDPNRVYEIAKNTAAQQNILLIRAAEITRDTPPGHYNALFLSDINSLVTTEFLDAVGKANEQKAFVFWNHHSWKGPERGQWAEIQTILYEKKWLHGMEVANGETYYPQAHAWCLEKNLTMVGNSDIHDPSIDYQYTPQKHRSLTLVFAKERTVESIHDALIAGRTAVWHENRLIGREGYLRPLFEACVTVSKSGDNALHLANYALIDLMLERQGTIGPAGLVLPARSANITEVPMPEDQPEMSLAYTVSNFLIAPDTGLPVELTIPNTEAE